MAAAAAASAAAVAAASAAGDSASSAADAHPSVVISASRTSAGTAWSDPVVVKHRKSPKERSIFVIYMGGTLGMKPNEEGARQPDGAVQVRPAALVDALPTFRGCTACPWPPSQERLSRRQGTF